MRETFSFNYSHSFAEKKNFFSFDKGLTPGRLYNITVWTVSGGVQSLPIQRQDRMYPEPITILNATQITHDSITLTWDNPQGEYNSFEVQYLLRSDSSDVTGNITNQNSITITDLRPHRNYTFTVVVRSGTESNVLRSSLPVSASFTTKESIPGSVNRFTPIDIQPSQIVFEWTLPVTEQNGILQQFSITYGLEGSSHTQQKDFKPTELTGTISYLLPGRTYAFRIQAKTNIGFGPETVWKQKMPILAPPKPATQVVPTEVYRSSSSIQIRFRKNYFSDANGQVNNFVGNSFENDFNSIFSPFNRLTCIRLLLLKIIRKMHLVLRCQVGEMFNHTVFGHHIK